MSIQDDLELMAGELPESALLPVMIAPWISQAVYVAAKLGIADLLTSGRKSVAELADLAGASPRELHRLLSCLAGIGIFAEVEDGTFEMTARAAELRSGVPGSVRSLVLWYGGESFKAWGNLLHSLGTGETAFNHTYGSGPFDYMGRHPETAAIFNEAMTEWTVGESEAIMRAYDFAGFHKVVDIGGGQGLFIGDVLKAHPGLDGVLFELPQVVAGAREYLQAAGLAGRCELVGGDFLESVPSGGDAYVLKNVLVNWDDERSARLLKNCHRAMVENGRLLVIEISVIAPRNAPSFGKLFDLHMMVMTGGRGRSETEFRALFEAAGFRLANIIPTEAAVSIIEAIRV